jgi:16S rRNA (adenine1518-N6/adenine1519-N6)-dimethyltransferase
MSKLADITKRHSIGANKSLGQNFIYDTKILSKIANTQDEGSICLEIGCGPGGLTNELSKVCSRVIGIELDKKFADIYDEFLDNNNIKIIFDDFMKIDIDKLFNEYIKESFSVCANLPYYITTPILMRLLDSDLPIKSITILVQKEVADRLVSSHNCKSYGVLTVMTRARGEISKLFDLQPGAFTPPPSVVSTLVKIDIKNNIIESNIDDFRKCVRAAFSSRRKQMKNNISTAYNISKDKVSEILDNIGLSDKVRAENLTVEDYDKLTKVLKSI